jgi:hypothetical protein
VLFERHFYENRDITVQIAFLDGSRTVFRFAQNACKKRILRGDRVFERKIEDFSFQKKVAPIDFLKGRLSSEARNSP